MRLYLSDNEKKNIADIIEQEYTAAFRINSDTGMASVYFGDSSLAEKTGRSFDYEKEVRQYLQELSTDTDPDSLAEKLTIASVSKFLEKDRRYVLHLTSRGGPEEVNLYELSFFKGRTNEILLFVRDITDLYRDAARNIASLQNAYDSEEDELRGKNTFLRLMNRSIRTPLYSIMGLTHIAENDQTDSTAFDDYIHKISMSGTYMAETIDDVLDLRRIARHELQLHPERIELKSFFENVKNIISASIYNRGLKLTIEADEAAALIVFADRHGLQQVAVKLLQSTISYTLKGGRICLHVRRLYQTEKKVTLEFEVESRGIVIDTERLQTIFRPGYLVDKINADIGSVDMDLIILKSYALQMGCDTITTETDEKEGTRVSLSLTLDLAEDKNRSRRPAGKPVNLKGMRILLADDNEINLEIASRTLEENGIAVTPARNSQEALDCYRRQNGAFDVILMDILMPVMDGLEATRQIRRLNLEGASSIPIIAMTANAFQENFEESAHAGMNAHLVKPVDPDTLLAVIRQTLEESRTDTAAQP